MDPKEALRQHLSQIAISELILLENSTRLMSDMDKSYRIQEWNMTWKEVAELIREVSDERSRGNQ